MVMLLVDILIDVYSVPRYSSIAIHPTNPFLGILYSGFKRTHGFGWRPRLDFWFFWFLSIVERNEFKDDLWIHRRGYWVGDLLWLPYGWSMDTADAVAARLESIWKRAHAVGSGAVVIVHCKGAKVFRGANESIYENGIMWSLDKRRREE
jgi:hypothetical protein